MSFVVGRARHFLLGAQCDLLPREQVQLHVDALRCQPGGVMLLMQAGWVVVLQFDEEALNLFRRL